MLVDEGTCDESRRRRVAVLSVTEPFPAAITAAIGDIACVIPISSQAELLDQLRDRQHFDLVVCAHWRWILPRSVVDAWPCIGVHTSPLPRGRGGSPIQNQILRGLYDSQVCVFKVTEELDSGDLLASRPISLREGTIEQIIEDVAHLTAEMVLELLLHMTSGQPQRGEVTSYERLRPEQSRFDPSVLSLREIYDRIRMVDGFDYPRAFLEFGTWRVVFSNARVLDDGSLTADATFVPRQ